MKIPNALLNFHEHNLSYDLLELKEFNDVMENFLKTANHATSQETQEHFRNLPLALDDEQISFSPNFKNLLRSSNLTSIITVTEINLKSFCDSLLIRSHSMFFFKDLKGNSDFEKIKVVLNKTEFVDFQTIEREWTFIDNSRLIRNKFVHNNGIITGNHNDFNRITDFVNKNPDLFEKHLEHGKYYHIKIKKEFIYKLIETIFFLF